MYRSTTREALTLRSSSRILQRTSVDFLNGMNDKIIIFIICIALSTDFTQQARINALISRWSVSSHIKPPAPALWISTPTSKTSASADLTRPAPIYYLTSFAPLQQSQPCSSSWPCACYLSPSCRAALQQKPCTVASTSTSAASTSTPPMAGYSTTRCTSRSSRRRAAAPSHTRLSFYTVALKPALYVSLRKPSWFMLTSIELPE